MNLNIIGNGFDLYHGLPSSYYYFGCYLINTDSEFYGEIGNMYELKHLQMVGSPLAHDYDYVVENIFWSDFESHLSKVDKFFVVDTSLDDLDLENPDPVEIELEQDMSADQLKNKFAMWVNETIDIESNYTLIKKRFLNSSDIQFNDDDYFLQFNYTHLLQELYQVYDSRIHYVHGECYGDDGVELVVGHGNDSRIQDIKDLIEKLDSEYDYTQSSYNRINEYRCLLEYLRKLRKNVGECMLESRYFYEGIKEEVENIKVYGLSLGEVDIPYLIQIRNMWPNAKWEFSFYSDSGKERIDTIAQERLDLSEDDYSKFKLSHPFSREVCSEIIRALDIEEYKCV